RATIVGFSEPSGSRTGLGALLLAEDGRYIGKVGTGFDERTLRELRARLEPLKVQRPELEGVPRSLRGVHWVEPKLSAEVSFAERTRDGKLRHPVFIGVHEPVRAARMSASK